MVTVTWGVCVKEDTCVNPYMNISTSQPAHFLRTCCQLAGRKSQVSTFYKCGPAAASEAMGLQAVLSRLVTKGG